MLLRHAGFLDTDRFPHQPATDRAARGIAEHASSNSSRMLGVNIMPRGDMAIEDADQLRSWLAGARGKKIQTTHNGCLEFGEALTLVLRDDPDASRIVGSRSNGRSSRSRQESQQHATISAKHSSVIEHQRFARALCLRFSGLQRFRIFVSRGHWHCCIGARRARERQLLPPENSLTRPRSVCSVLRSLSVSRYLSWRPRSGT